MQIVDLIAGDAARVAAAASLLEADGWDQGPRGWPTPEEARAEVEAMLEPDRIARVALGDDGEVLGVVGAIDQYGGPTWELHPLVVAPAARGQGVGAALVADLEAQVLARGGRTLYLGTDDESATTSAGGHDLYPEPWRALEDLHTLPEHAPHPFEFYRRLGYALCGVIPDANGPGLPDLLMAKRLVDE